MSLRVASACSFVSLVAALSVAGCSGGPGGAPTPPASAQPDAVQVATPAAHGPGRWFFRRVEALDLRDDQRVALTSIQSKLAQDLAPQREAGRAALVRLADAIEKGELDAQGALEQKAALTAALEVAKGSFAEALDDVHDTLDGPQRLALVADLRAHHEGHLDHPRQHERGLARLALTLGLSEDQRAMIANAVSQGLDDLFPGRKTRREEAEARMKAMGDAFVTDDFEARDYDLASHAEEALTSGVEIAGRAVDVSTRVLSPGQRKLAADLMRDKAAEI